MGQERERETEKEREREREFIQDIHASRTGTVEDIAIASLPVSIREVVKYRVRKKQMLSGLIVNLADLHKKMCEDEMNTLLPPPPMSSGDGRRARIRELLNEVRSKSGTAEKEEELLAAASRWSSKWTDKGLSL